MTAKKLTIDSLLASEAPEHEDFEDELTIVRKALRRAIDEGKKVPVGRIDKKYHSRIDDLVDGVNGDLDATAAPTAGTPGAAPAAPAAVVNTGMPGDIHTLLNMGPGGMAAYESPSTLRIYVWKDGVMHSIEKDKWSMIPGSDAQRAQKVIDGTAHKGGFGQKLRSIIGSRSASGPRA